MRHHPVRQPPEQNRSGQNRNADRETGLAELRLDRQRPPEEEHRKYEQQDHPEAAGQKSERQQPERTDPPHAPVRPAHTELEKDQLGRQQLIDKLIEINEFADFSDIVPVSALEHDNLDEVRQVLIDNTPEGPQMYPDDQVSEERPEDTIAELIRGAFLEELDDELPHSLAVVVDSIERPEDNESGQSYEGKIQVMVSVYVERDSQKPIIIGRGAEHLVRVKKKLRTPVNRIVGGKAKLDLHVKVAKGWQSDPKQLERLGF